VGTSVLGGEQAWAELSDAEAVEIVVETHNGEVQVGDDYALIYLPIVRKPAGR